ncbi:MAG: methyltransferase domain-containing protein [Brevundimonas sp.]
MPTAPTPPPVLFDARRRAARLARARLDRAYFLHRRVAEDAVESLEAILREFPAVVDASALAGPFAGALAASDAAARVGPVRAVAPPADPGAASLAVEPGSADLIVSLLTLHWANDLPGALAQIRRALKPDGLFLAALFGAGTLKELRGALTEAELELRGGAQARVSPFADGYDGAGLLQRAGFALPVSDVDRVTVRYPDMFALVRDLRAMGETSALAGPVRPLTRDIAARAAELYAQRHAQADGRIPATFEIIRLTGWAPHESQPKPLPRGSAKVRLAEALGVKEIKAGPDGTVS